MRWRAFLILSTCITFTAPCAIHAAESVARKWNEQILAAIRIDFPDPAVHARNLFHTSVAMWDAWAAYSPTATGYIHREAATSADLQAAREEAISYAAYRVLSHRYQLSVNAATTQAELDFLMDDPVDGLGYDSTVTTTSGDNPAAVGNRVAASVIAFFGGDGSNEAGGYEDTSYTALNDPMILALPFELMTEPNHWQPLAFEFAITQNGLEAEQVQTFLGSHWGEVWTFAARRDEGQTVYFDPGQPPQLGGSGDTAFKEGSRDVVRYSRLLDPDEAPMIDCSPGAIGNNTLGQNDGSGHPLNPSTDLPYPPNSVSEADFGRSVAEYWADGPDSETPPGHWNKIANEVVAHPSFERRIGGTDDPLDPLEWDVKMYFALNAAVHDAAVAAWGCKRNYDYVRPISSIRQLCKTGTMPLEAGLVEVVSAESAAPGQRHAHLAPHIGKIALYCWGGEPADPETEYTGNEWILGERWMPYQRDTFVTPAFAGYISGHSTFSRAAAEVLTAMTGSEFFPDGIASHTVTAGSLEFEYGPSADVTLQWATYFDAADQAGLSRLYGGIHVPVDDGPGRIVGAECGKAAWAKAEKYFDGSILDEPVALRIERMPDGDVAVRWDQVRGLHYSLRSSPTVGGFSGPAPAQATEDHAEAIIPAGSLSGSQFFTVEQTDGLE